MAEWRLCAAIHTDTCRAEWRCQPMSRVTMLVAITLIVSLVGCSQSEFPPTRQGVVPSHYLTTTPKTQSDSVALVHHVARHLALSLADSRVRSQLRTALARTTVREGKLHLQRFLRHRGANLGALVSGFSGLGETGWVEEVSLLPDLEMYLPIETHRQAWKRYSRHSGLRRASPSSWSCSSPSIP